LGGGPTGEVYRAKVYGIAGMDRDFAVKRFHPSFVTGSAAAAEIAVAAQLYGSLDHPKIAKLQELGTSGDSTFTAVEFVPGVDLAQLIDHGQLPLGAAARLVVQICRAVGYAHSRGIRHLGLAPTNVICSERGEIKVTDFGFLLPRLPKRPAEDTSLQSRLCYLAPEQLEGKKCTQATDVYQLGTMAFELMVGRKPYAGRSGVALAHQILSGVAPASGLPRPYQKLLQRALARSPFVRFPDAGAMADAIEAALRASPADGTLEDVGNAVSEREVFLASTRESQASGALSFPIPSPPKETQPDASSIVTPPAAKGREGSSLARLKLKKKPVVVGTNADNDQTKDTEINFAKDTVDVELTSNGDSERDTVPTMETPEEQQTDTEETAPGGAPVHTPPPPTPAAARRKSGSLAAAVPEASPTANIDYADLMEIDEDEMVEMAPDELQVAATKEMPKLGIANLLAGGDGPVTEKDAASPAANFPPPLDELIVTPPPLDGEGKAGGLSPFIKYPIMAVAVLGMAFLTFSLLASDDAKDREEAVVSADTKDAAPSVPVTDAKMVTKVVPPPLTPDSSDAASIEIPVPLTTEDAAVLEVVDAATAPVVPTVTPGDGDLKVGSQPPGAKVYLDGSLVGTTPVQLESTADKHRLALVLPGYGLYTGEIDGKGFFNIDLSEVTPTDGPAGIKVRCKQTNRYYVFVDGKASGQLCPTERIGVFKGKHVVEIYDPVTDTRREFNVNVEDTRLSVRVRVD
jgi:serine/threonine protein kinase